MKASSHLIQDYPDAFLNRMSRLLGDEFVDFLASLHQPAINGLRVNTLKVAPQKYLENSPFHLAPVPWCPSGFIVEGMEIGDLIPPGKHPHHHAGLYYLQEPSAMAAAEVLAPLPGEAVLDLAAAPGGKATHLAALMKNMGLLVANEIHPKRVWDLVENLERCGVTNSVVTNESPRNLADHFGEYFDRVLLDAPCSGEGMFRKGDTARKEWQLEHVRICAFRQTAILEEAARLVCPGGRLAYTTCTFSVEENEGVIAKFLNHHPEFDLEEINSVQGFQPARPDWVGYAADPRLSRAVRLWPHHSQSEGHFIALLIKQGPTENRLAAGEKISRLNSDKFVRAKRKLVPKSIMEEFGRNNPSFSLDESKLILEGTYIYQLPDRYPSLQGLNITHPGWWLGSISKGRFTPSHAFAMGIRGKQTQQAIDMGVGDKRLAAFFAGESFSDSGENVWVLVMVDGYPVGWGKRVNNIVKNFYPKGLRRFG